jgi:hypothetical protein
VSPRRYVAISIRRAFLSVICRYGGQSFPRLPRPMGTSLFRLGKGLSSERVERRHILMSRSLERHFAALRTARLAEPMSWHARVFGGCLVRGKARELVWAARGFRRDIR